MARGKKAKEIEKVEPEELEEGLSSAELEKELEGTGIVLSGEESPITEGVSFKKLKAKLALKTKKNKFSL